MTADQQDTPVTWHYLPVIHCRKLDSGVQLILTDHDGSVIRTTIANPEHVDLLDPYLHLYELEQRDPWTNGSAFVPVEQTDGRWHFSAAGAHYDRLAATDSGTAEVGDAIPYRRPTFQ